ncbi:alpha/beta-hydrolase [Rhizopogon salebrosus TDB-379]|nr:alpha/beta-hydrolase [Rhizopogon salebrosus TDB-379]
MSISASQWGSPIASRRALLLHGLTMSSHSWEGVAQLLTAEGFFVIAPNLLGHAWRRGSDYRASVLAEDLKPYFTMGTSYDVIIGHSFGGALALSLLPFLPEKKEATVILVDPVLEISDERYQSFKLRFLKEVANIKTADEYMAENSAWSRRDCALRTLALSMCTSTDIEELFQHNTPWSFSGLFKDIPLNVKITVLVADPRFSKICRLEHIPSDVERLHAVVVTGVGHCIQFESPNAIIDAVPLGRTKL